MTSLVGPSATNTAVLLLGDTDTTAHREDLTATAQRRGFVVADIYAFDLWEPGRTADLTEIAAVVAALARAIADHLDIWVPFLSPDLGREQHSRRISLVLQRHGLNLRTGRKLWALPAESGVNEIDWALRSEVRAVDALDNAALAAAGVKKLSAEIERTLVAAARTVGPKRTSVAGGDHRRQESAGPPVLPPAHVPWRYRKPLVIGYVRWLVDGCGVSQAATARVLNSSGQRTASGRVWRSGSVGALLRG
ncbi:hypothetical protein H7J77_11295 [Mycolicibacillus parakoreensis]|uniref:Recombinase family protein n=1 Tax=Mycolicibacillus parakoreensis TaxID=1069221 RepID=A0ABY3U3B9_9MYCO|nr:hypothetical protein [Mycolicibacillus parakoreensis]MCV7316124.1 hypothetical protein [Mycolicibacillus parakoreensis]ULN52261.1 hypothetical protein MIU77_15620 [Mycolicibacillus parakoreensis]